MSVVAMDIDQEIAELARQIGELKSRLAEARRNRPPEPIADYALQNPDGSTVMLSDLFGDKDDLLVVHNMGRGCVYCTMWADGFVGSLPHLENRAAFVVVSPDEPAVQSAFARSRGWTFRMASAAGSDFVRDLGFAAEHDGELHFQPGISALHRTADGGIVRTGSDRFGPGDDYCAPWPMFELLAGGAGDWEPRYRYSASAS